jgi:hypothetical protein
MFEYQKRHVRLIILDVWLLLHALALFMSWRYVVFLILFTPPYIGLSHVLGRSYKLGGLAAMRDPEDSTKKADNLQVNLNSAPDDTESELNDGTRLTETDSTGSHARERHAMDKQSLQITTGFAAILFFNTVRFYYDSTSRRDMDDRLPVILGISSITLCLSCVFNLVQLQFLRVLDTPRVVGTIKKEIRRKLRFLSALSWHCLITPIVLLLMLMDSRWAALIINGIYGLSLFLYYFWFAPKSEQRSGLSLKANPHRISSSASRR